MKAIQIERDGSRTAVDVPNKPSYNVPLFETMTVVPVPGGSESTVTYAHYIRRGVMFDKETRIYCREGIAIKLWEGEVLLRPGDDETVPRMWNEMRRQVGIKFAWHVIVDESDTPCEGHDEKVREAIAAGKIVKRKLRMLVAVADTTHCNAGG